MRKIIYSKYNRKRMPQFQIATQIAEQEGKRSVIKTPLTTEAKSHIDSFTNKSESISNIFPNLFPVPVKINEGKAIFDWVEGYTASSYVWSYSKNINEMLDILKSTINEVLECDKSALIDFYLTEDFVKVFGKYDSNDVCSAVSGADIDLILENLINVDGKWNVIDYEWTFDFPVPIDYIKYRILFWFYFKRRNYIEKHMTYEQFMEYFDISINSISKYKQMEDKFQEYVRGDMQEYYYQTQYELTVHDVRTLLRDNKVDNMIEDLRNDVQQLRVEKKELTTERNNYQQAYENVLNSKSWKLTAPLRRIALVPEYAKTHGIMKTVSHAFSVLFKRSKVMNDLDSVSNLPPVYHYEPIDEDECEYQRQKKFKKDIKFSILVPLYNTPEQFLKEMIESVQFQTYSNWELCLADGSDENHSEVEAICKKYIDADDRIKYKKIELNLGISENTNVCIDMASGDYIALFDHDDLLPQNALYEVMNVIEEKGADIIYTDEDKLLYDEETGLKQFVEPHFKPDLNMDLLLSCNYITHFFVASKSLVDKVGGFRKEFDGSQDYDFIIRCVEQAENIQHIHKVLYHWRMHVNSTAADPKSKMYCYEAGKKAIESHLERMHIDASVEMERHLGFYHVNYPVHDTPLVSIIIPNKDEKSTLEKCINSILKKSTYNNYEIIIVENNSVSNEIFQYYDEIEKNSKIKVIHWKGEFNYSKINNWGVQHSSGEYIILLNNDIEILSEDWIENMLSNCQRDNVGITGAKLLYPDRTVQHCGVIIGLGGIAGHPFIGIDEMHPGYFGRAYIQQNLSAVTAACLMIRKKIYEEVGGMEEQLQVAFNDVDFCLKVRKAGYLIVMNPRVLLMHYESKTRGQDDTQEKRERFESEVNFMTQRWGDILKEGDPYYNRNLTLFRSDFSVAE